MATSSSEGSCSVQNDFDITSSLEESNGKYCFSCERCPLCLTPKRRYYCKYCIESGDFVHSNNNNSSEEIKESFSEKKSRIMKLKRDRLLALSNLTIVLEQNSKADKLKTQINDCQEKIRLYKLSIADVKLEVLQLKKNSITKFNSIKKRRLELSDSFKRLGQVKDKEQRVFKRYEETNFVLDKKRTKLKRVRKIRVNELVESIFPISRVSFDEPQEDTLNQARICALADATQTAFVSGRWIYTENSGNIFYRIIEALLPANGDYSLYSTWVSNRDLMPSQSTLSNIHQHQAYGVSAALTYFCQLVSSTAFYLNIWLPHRLCYSEFCSHDMNLQDFQCKLAKLNSNVVHVCLLQNVDPQLLSKQSCAANLTHLLNPASSDLGRMGPSQRISDLIFYDLNVVIENSSEELESLEDWEEINDPDILIPKQIKHNYVLPPETASAAGGLMQSAVASISSFWRAATGQK